MLELLHARHTVSVSPHFAGRFSNVEARELIVIQQFQLNVPAIALEVIL